MSLKSSGIYLYNDCYLVGVEEILGTVEGVAHPHDATMETDILPKEAPPPPPPLSDKEKGENFPHLELKSYRMRLSIRNSVCRMPSDCIMPQVFTTKVSRLAGL